MYRALRNGCAEELDMVLRADADAVFDFSFDYNKPPLVAAINMECDRNMIRILFPFVFKVQRCLQSFENGFETSYNCNFKTVV